MEYAYSNDKKRKTLCVSVNCGYLGGFYRMCWVSGKATDSTRTTAIPLQKAAARISEKPDALTDIAPYVIIKIT